MLDTNGDGIGKPVLYSQGTAVGTTDFIGSQFNTVLTDNTGPLVSNITFTPTLNINNYTVQCGDVSVSMNCSIMIAGRSMS